MPCYSSVTNYETPLDVLAKRMLKKNAMFFLFRSKRERIMSKNLFCVNCDSENVQYITMQGRSHDFDIGGAQASKIILGPFCLTYWRGTNLAFTIV